jgi:orotate phosphoribosyltransferase
MPDDLTDDVLDLLPFRSGHFRFESGHHGDSWLDLERLCLRPKTLARLAVQLAERLERQRIEVVCAPLVEGAFVGVMVAAELDVPFTYSERLAPDPAGGLFPHRYRVPEVLRPSLAGKRVAIVNDVINAGSAVRGTLLDLEDRGANPVVIGTLAVLGDPASRLAADHRVALETLTAVPYSIWPPADCPLCARNVPLSA